MVSFSLNETKKETLIQKPRQPKKKQANKRYWPDGFGKVLVA